jgi:hypothetical protein
LAVFFALPFDVKTVSADIAHRGFHGVRLRITHWHLRGFATASALGSDQALGTGVAFFGCAWIRRTWPHAVATAAAAGALGAVVVGWAAF